MLVELLVCDDRGLVLVLLLVDRFLVLVLSPLHRSCLDDPCAASLPSCVLALVQT